MWSDPSPDEPGCGRATLLARVLLFSRGYTVFVVLQVLLNLALFIWEIATVAGFSLPDHWVFGVLEVWVNAALLGEVVLRLLANGSVRAYLRDKANWFDLVVLTFSVTAMLILLTGKPWLESLASEVTLVLLAVRYIVVLLRVALLLKAQGRTLATQFTERIEFVSAMPPRDTEQVALTAGAAGAASKRSFRQSTHADELENEDEDEHDRGRRGDRAQEPDFEF